MSHRSANKVSKSNDEALAAFVAKKAEIDTMLQRFRALSDDHFGVAPDEVTWAGGQVRGPRYLPVSF